MKYSDFASREQLIVCQFMEGGVLKHLGFSHDLEGKEGMGAFRIILIYLEGLKFELYRYNLFINKISRRPSTNLCKQSPNFAYFAQFAYFAFTI